MSVSMIMQILVKIHSFILKILCGNEFDIVSINDDANFGQNPLICSQDIERKRNYDVIQGP